MVNIEVCGLYCAECQFFGETCPGCSEIRGKTFWAEEIMPKKVCPIYDCSVNENDYKTCGECSDLPCNIFNELKDPNISDEEHEKSILERTRKLKSK